MAVLKKFAIDLGSRTTRVWEVGVGLILTEPTVLVWGSEDHKLLAIGEDALEMEGKQPEYMEVVRPVRQGVVRDFEATRIFVAHILKKVAKMSWLFGSQVLLPMPYGTNQVEQKALTDAVKAAGAVKVLLVDGPLATALGAKISIAESFGNMVMNLGEGISESAVLALGGVVAAKSIRFGGGDMDERLVEFFRKQHNLLIGYGGARTLREQHFEAVRPKHPEKIEVMGRDVVYGLPKSVNIGSDELYEALKDSLNHIVGLAGSVLAQTPPELVADIMDRGLILAGGLAQTKNMAKYLSSVLNIAVHLVNDPMECTIRGAGIIYENLSVYERAIR
jgi:rod shape-determining protein MreB